MFEARWIPEENFDDAALLVRDLAGDSPEEEI